MVVILAGRVTIGILCVRIQVRPAEANGSGMTSWKVPDNWNILGSSKSIQTPTYNDKFQFSLERDVNTYPCREKVGTKTLWPIQTISNWRILWHFLKVSSGEGKHDNKWKLFQIFFLYLVFVCRIVRCRRMVTKKLPSLKWRGGANNF